MLSSIWIDTRYIGLISSRLDHFIRKGPTLWNFRCTICGDSKKSKIKARAYIFQRGQNFLYRCHNCGSSMFFSKFLETLSPELYKDYLRDLYLEKGNFKQEIEEPVKKEVISFNPVLELPTIADLPPNHVAKEYIVNRKIPFKYQLELRYVSKFNAWVNSFLTGKLPEYDISPRIIIPFLNEEKKLIGFTGRSLPFYVKSLRYITIMLDPDAPKVYGLDKVDKTKTVYILEGAFDAMFIPNSIAMAGADIPNIFEDTVTIYDNEKRNKEIIYRMEKVINLGRKLFIWPIHLKYKDINDMALAGYSIGEIKSIIDENGFKGLEAKVKIIEWKRGV